MRLQPHLVRMTVGGMKVDTELKERIAGELREEVARLIVDFHNAVQLATGDADYRPSPRSPAQLRELFFGRLKLVGRGISVDATNRKRMLDHHKTDERSKNVIRVIDKFKKEDKFLGTYAEMTIDDDERIRCDWKQYGTVNAPGRLSSSSVMWGSGTNLQNQPQRAYAMFIADPGYELFYFDLSQAEARYVGWEANIPKWKEQFERARLNPGAYDCHRALAAEMWGIPYDDVPSKDRDADGNVTKRFTAKRCRHGLNYRMGPDRLAETTGLPLNEAHSAYNIYHRITPELRKWWSELEQEVKRTKMLFNAFGRRLFVLERIDENSLESIVAFKPQSSIGDKVSSVIYLSESDDNWPRHARILLNVHDALVGIARKDVTKTALSICKRYAEAPIMVRGEPLIIPADCKISVAGEDGVHRWSTLKEVHL
jgi:DNA polymerase I-like protein with 3'-5' exonuclease and polymerase domains